MNNVPDSTPPAPGRLPAVAFAMLFPTLVTWVYFVWAADRSAAWQQSSYAIGKLIQFAFPVVMCYLVWRRPLPRSWPGPRGLAAGAAFGAVVATAMLLLYHGWLKPAGFFAGPGEAVRAKVAGLGLSSVGLYAALGVFYSLGHSLLEEYYWRWFVFAQTRRLTTWPTAVWISSLGFMAHHVLLLATYFGWASPATYFFSASIAVGGAVWAWLFHRTESLLGVWFSHALVDAAIFLIGYDLVADLLRR